MCVKRRVRGINEPFGFIPLPFTCTYKTNKTKGLIETSKYSAKTGRQTELFEQWIFKSIECLKFYLLHANCPFRNSNGDW